MTSDDLNARVMKLEASNRIMKRTLLSIAVCFVISCLVGANCYRWYEHRANRFVLVDSCGTERASLGFDNGEPVLQMIGSSGTTQVKLGITEVHGDSASLYLQNADKNTFATLAATSTVGSATLEFGGGQKRVNIRTSLPRQDPGLRFTDEAGNETYKAP